MSLAARKLPPTISDERLNREVVNGIEMMSPRPAIPRDCQGRVRRREAITMPPQNATKNRT